MKKRLFIVLMAMATLLLFNTAAASAETIQWGPVHEGYFTPYYNYDSNSDQGFDVHTGVMTTDPAQRDFIVYWDLNVDKTKGFYGLGSELLTAATELPEGIWDTQGQISLGEPFIIQCQDNTYAKIVFTKETRDGVEFEYVVQKGAEQAPTDPATGTTTPAAGTATADTTGTGSTTPGTGGGPVTIINNNTTINQNTNTTTNNANTNTNISGSTITNSNIASNNQTSQTTSNDNSIKVTQYVSVMVNGQPLQSDVKPFINGDGRTMLPVRAIAEALGATVQWDAATQTATLSQGDKTVKVPVGQRTISVDGNPVAMDTAAVIKDGRTLLPVRPIAEALGVKIDWDAATSTVKIEKPGSINSQTEDPEEGVENINPAGQVTKPEGSGDGNLGENLPWANPGDLSGEWGGKPVN